MLRQQAGDEPAKLRFRRRTVFPPTSHTNGVQRIRARRHRQRLPRRPLLHGLTEPPRPPPVPRGHPAPSPARRCDPGTRALGRDAYDARGHPFDTSESPPHEDWQQSARTSEPGRRRTPVPHSHRRGTVLPQRHPEPSEPLIENKCRRTRDWSADSDVRVNDPCGNRCRDR